MTNDLKGHNGWTVTTLGEVARNASRSFDFNQHQNVVFINTGDVLEGKFLHSNKTMKQGLPGQAKKSIKNGDILLSEIRPANKRYAKVNFDAENYVVSTKFMVIEGNDKIDLNYLYILLTSDKTLQEFQIIAESRSGTFPQITFDAISRFELPLPSLPEQSAIASVLSSFDDKIELLHKQNQTLEAMAQAIFKEWFVDYRFPGVGKMIESELGLVPEGWRVGKVKDIVEIFDNQRIPLSSREREKRIGNFPYYGATSIMDYVDDYLFDGIFLLLAEDGSVTDDKGYPVLQYVWGQFWVNNHAHILQGKNGFTTEMIYLLFRITNVSGIINGAVQLKINQGNLLNLEIILPERKLIDAFSKAIEPIFQKIRSNSNQIQTLTKIRNTLLPKLISGEVRVSYGILNG